MKNKTLILNLIGAIFLSSRVQAGVQTSGYCGPKDEQGNYGTNCQWSLNNGILTISGNGSMADLALRMLIIQMVQNHLGINFIRRLIQSMLNMELKILERVHLKVWKICKISISLILLKK